MKETTLPAEQLYRTDQFRFTNPNRSEVQVAAEEEAQLQAQEGKPQQALQPRLPAQLVAAVEIQTGRQLQLPQDNLQLLQELQPVALRQHVKRKQQDLQARVQLQEVRALGVSKALLEDKQDLQQLPPGLNQTMTTAQA